MFNPSAFIKEFDMDYVAIAIAGLVTLVSLPVMFAIWLVFRVVMWFIADKPENDKDRTTLYSPGKIF